MIVWENCISKLHRLNDTQQTSAARGINQFGRLLCEAFWFCSLPHLHPRIAARHEIQRSALGIVAGNFRHAAHLSHKVASIMTSVEQGRAWGTLDELNALYGQRADSQLTWSKTLARAFSRPLNIMLAFEKMMVWCRLRMLAMKFISFVRPCSSFMEVIISSTRWSFQIVCRLVICVAIWRTHDTY